MMTYKKLCCICAALGLLGCVEVQEHEDIESNTSHNPPSSPAQTTPIDEKINEEEQPQNLDLNDLYYVHSAIGSEETPRDMCTWVKGLLDEGSKIIKLTSINVERPTCESPGPYGSAGYVELGYEEVYNIANPEAELVTGTFHRLNSNFQYKSPSPGDFMIVTYFNYQGSDILLIDDFLLTDASSYERGPDSPVLPTSADAFAASYKEHHENFDSLCPEFVRQERNKDDIMTDFINEYGACD